MEKKKESENNWLFLQINVVRPKSIILWWREKEKVKKRIFFRNKHSMFLQKVGSIIGGEKRE